MSFMKSRADLQDRYRRELFTGTVVACQADGTYDVELIGVDEPLRGVQYGGTLRFQVGNRVVLHRLEGRDAWQIHAGAAHAAPAHYTNPAALIDTPPLVYWEGLPRTATDPTTIAQVLAAQPGGSGLSLEAVRAPSAAALYNVLAQASLPTPPPPGIGIWCAEEATAIDQTQSCGAFAYPQRYGAIRAGAYPVDAGTLAYWKLNEPNLSDLALDCSGHAYDLYMPNVTGAVPSNFHSARAWNGSTSYGRHTPLPLQGLETLTLEVWCKADNLAGSPYLLYQSGCVALHLPDGGTVRCDVLTGNGIGSAIASAPGSLADGAWHYLAGVYDGTQVHLYLDGLALAAAPLTGGIRQPDGDGWYVGVCAPTWTGWSRYFSGHLQEVRVSTVARSATEITRAWEGRLAHHAVTPALPIPPSTHIMLGAIAEDHGGTLAYALASDATTWHSALPWEWTTVPLTETCHARATLTGQAEVHKIGVLCCP